MAKKTSLPNWEFRNESLVVRAMGRKPADGARVVEVFVHDKKTSDPSGIWRDYFPNRGQSAQQLLRTAETKEKTIVLVSPLAPAENELESTLQAAVATRFREAMGALVSQLERWEGAEVHLHLDFKEELLIAAITGLEIALYRFQRYIAEDDSKFLLKILANGKPLASGAVAMMATQGIALNLSRHLTNLPANLLNPTTYSDFLKRFFAKVKNTRVEVWSAERLHKENMNLHYAVGQASQTPPCMVHLRYRAKGPRAKIALVGKGVTFDSGGLDIKPASGMRNMKKDMGGSASACGIFLTVAQLGLAVDLDVYLALAENAIGESAFRPGDILTARNGLTVEIHNTDAEGRLVLADSLALATESELDYVIDLATLTGASRVALGAVVGGLWASDKKLRDSLHEAGQQSGDYNWPMPLVQRYRGQLQSVVASMTNASDGFAGAITAALFLQKFVKDVPWAHLDIYCWRDSADGAHLETGGSGQGVLAVVHWLKTLANAKIMSRAKKMRGRP